jgi:plastocyanin
VQTAPQEIIMANAAPPIDETRPDELDVVPDVPDVPPAATRSFVAQLQWTEIGAGLAGLLSVIAIIVSLVALSTKSSSTVTTVTAPVTPAARVPAIAPLSMTINIKTDAEHGRLGPGGVWHDAFLPANFSVKAGQTVTINFLNYDNGPHTFTSPSLGVNAIIPGGNGSIAKETTFTFKAPSKPGTYEWWCSTPCDPWAMKHLGYMRGIVTVRA